MTETTDNHPVDARGPAAFAKLVRKGGPAVNAEPYWTSRYLFRPWTGYLSWLLVKLRLTPNGITLISALCFIGGSVSLLCPVPIAWLGAALLILIYHALDHCDGEVARYQRLTGKKQGALDGEYWDGMVHALEPLLVMCIGWRIFRDDHLEFWPLLIVAVNVVALTMVPWHRCCEVVVAWMQQRLRDGRPVTEDPLPSKAQTSTVLSGQQRSLKQRVVVFVAQLLLFPGYYVLLIVALVLDAVIVAPMEVGGAIVRFQLLWLLLHTAGKAAFALRSGIACGRLLRQVTP